MKEEIVTEKVGASPEALLNFNERFAETVGDAIISSRRRDKYRKVLSETDIEPGKKTYTFISTVDGFAMFEKNNRWFTFSNKTFITQNKEYADLIRRSRSFGIDVFEDELPAAVRAKINEREKYLTKDPDEYEK